MLAGLGAGHARPGAAGLAQLHQGMATILATGQTLSRPYCLVLLAEAAGNAGQVEEGLRLLAEALAAFEASGRGDMLTEAYRLQGEFLLRQASRIPPRRKPVFIKPLPSPAASRPRPGSCALP